jgi:hypothetical protein
MRHLKFISLLLFIILTRVYDYVSTKQFTPNLNQESNPLVTIVGLKWNGLTIVLSLLTLYAIYALYISIYKSDNLLPQEKGLTFKEFVPYFYLGYKDSLKSVFWKMPKTATRFNAIIGQILTLALVWAGFLSTVMWLLIKHTDWYYPEYHKPPLLYSLILLGILTAAYLFLKNSYKRYVAETNDKHEPLTSASKYGG